MEKQIDYCTHCRAETEYTLEKRNLTHTINGKSYVFKVTTAICTACGEEMAVRGWLKPLMKKLMRSQKRLDSQLIEPRRIRKGKVSRMEILKKVNDICPSCMKEHAVQIIRVHEHLTFKTVPVEFDAEYCYCEKTGVTYATEQQLTKNDIIMKDAYRKKMGLLTSDQIVKIRQKCGMSQSNLSRVLGWADDTIKRYESHEVQDIEDDKILRKIDLQKTNSVI